ncbi:DUF1700 domain-containing protein [Listeria booriae]|uniref:DUF1700 domain-containing protein n=1 Tax=Listeria booriae TaxID=1552123 RepID=UPI0016249D9C|nr:DUF1700 domain-containing protein [Listeria booriae]MBC2170835.1 DUF1700 domain-containing protein [Listeria booriae]MBC2326172.1 DUF1700 domain-containing protein [Listeria booriae]
MNRSEFLETLQHGLRSLPVEEREGIINDLDEHIAVSLENGVSEAEAIALLGQPADIIAQYVHGDIAEPKREQAPVIQKPVVAPTPTEAPPEKTTSKQVSPFKIVLIAGMCFIILMLLLDALD